MKAAIALLVLVLLTACSQAPDAPDALPEIPDVPAVQVETGGDAAPAESGTDKTFGELGEKTALDEVICDSAAKSVTFSFKNTDTRDWELNQNVPWPAPADLAPVRVYINSYEVNGRNPYIKEGVRQFGPAEKFSDNCGGVQRLAPGDSVTCTLTPVPLKEANDLIAGKNEILVHAPTSKQTIQFIC